MSIIDTSVQTILERKLLWGNRNWAGLGNETNDKKIMCGVRMVSLIFEGSIYCVGRGTPNFLK